MRISMNVIKNEHGVFHVRKKVPMKLEGATATVMDLSKPRVAWLKKSLGTKDLKAAKVRATSVLMEFYRILAAGRGALVERPQSPDEPSDIRAQPNQHFAPKTRGNSFTPLAA